MLRMRHGAGQGRHTPALSVGEDTHLLLDVKTGLVASQR
jgi:hypothetical protein